MLTSRINLRVLAVFVVAGVAAVAMTVSVICAIALVGRFPIGEVYLETILREISTPVLMGVFFGGCVCAFLCHLTVRKVLHVESIRHLFP